MATFKVRWVAGWEQPLAMLGDGFGDVAQGDAVAASGVSCKLGGVVEHGGPGGGGWATGGARAKTEHCGSASY